MAGSTIAISASQPHNSKMQIREIDAARALLGVRPVVNSHEQSQPNGQFPKSAPRKTDNNIQFTQVEYSEPVATTPHGFVVDPKSDMNDDSGEDIRSFIRRQRSDSTGLETLAALAAREQSLSTHRPLPSFLLPGGESRIASSSCPPFCTSPGHNSDTMPPPPPRCILGRQRSVSNPEGMEKWDSLLSRSSRRHFVLPASILEEELAEANEAVRLRSRSPIQVSSIPENAVFHEELESLILDSGREDVAANVPSTDSDTEQDLSPDELLRRARSRLIEDVSAEVCMVNGEKGFSALPHTLDKYKEMYSRNGRIGIYTPCERAAIIARFNDKRTRRNWNKKIRYNCRKSLADRRLRVKGRFVKRSEQEELSKKLQEEKIDQPIEAIATASRPRKRVTICENVEINEENPGSDDDAHDSDGVCESSDANDEDMPDVTDPDAGFSPTEDQPYRRLRRHTIT